MGLLTIIRKNKRREKEIRVLMVCVTSFSTSWMQYKFASRIPQAAEFNHFEPNDETGLGLCLGPEGMCFSEMHSM